MTALSQKAGVPPAPGGSVRILVAEDNADVAEILETLLSGETGLECVGAVPEAEEVAGALVRLRPDVLLLDLELNGVSGMDVLRACRRDHPEIVVIILSGHTSPAIIREAKAAGAADFLIKPDDLPTLGDRLRGAL